MVKTRGGKGGIIMGKVGFWAWVLQMKCLHKTMCPEEVSRLFPNSAGIRE
jgi:hypothetical protein